MRRRPPSANGPGTSRHFPSGAHGYRCGLSATGHRSPAPPRTCGGRALRDRGGALLEHAALLLLTVAVVAALTTALPRVVPDALRSTVERAVGSETATIGREPDPDGDWRLDPLDAAETVLRCLPTPDPVGRVDCALALLGLLESDVLEATILRIHADELVELFASGTFGATAVARAAVRLLWEHACDTALRRLVRTETFGFLEPALDSPGLQYTVRFVSVSGDYVRAVLEQSGESPRRTPRKRYPPHNEPQNRGAVSDDVDAAYRAGTR